MMAKAARREVELAFSGARIAITGGLGFIGSSLARRLASLGNDDVVVLDSQLPGSGANVFNLHGMHDKVRVEGCDIRDEAALRKQLKDREYLFNLAGQTSHQGSMTEPLLDLDINCRAQLVLLETCRRVNPTINIVFASTRQIYGRPDYLPVDEKHPIRPVDINGIDKHAAEEFHRLYHEVYGMQCCSLRLTNTYGPRMRIKDARQTFIGMWLRLVIEGRSFEVWGGDQLRDLTFIEDAVDAFLLAAVSKKTAGKAFNIGGCGHVSLRRLAELLIEANGGGHFEIRGFPRERQPVDIGDYYCDDRLFREATGWTPKTDLSDGLSQSLAYFREHFAHYV
jgi:UDP-glucose 4-epimerase